MDNNSRKLKRIQELFGNIDNDWKKQIASLESIENPINDMILRFPELAKQIFDGLDDESLTNCRITNLLWLGTLENMDIIWVRIMNKHSKLLKKIEKYQNSNSFLRSLRLKYHEKVFEKLSIIEEILGKSHEKNPNIMGKMTPLHVAAIQGNKYFTNLLLNKIGLQDVNPRDLSQWTPFMWATNVSDKKIPESDFGYSPFTVATKKMYHLLSKDRTLYELTKESCHSPMSWRSFIRDKERASLAVCEVMIDCNVDIETKTNFGETPLHRAAYRGNYHICKLIIEHSNNINPQDQNNMTPFHVAVIQGHVNVCELFVGSNVDTGAVTKDKRTALHLAALHGHLEICKLLIDRVKDKNPVTSGMFTPFHYAARKGHLSIVKLLIEKNVYVNMKTSRGRTALHIAADNGHFEVCQAIIEVVKEINPQDKDEFTPLDLSRKENIENLILSHAYQKQYKWTTLHIAANCGNLEDCQKIIQGLEDKNPIESNGLTPMHLAAMNGHVWVYKWISRNIEDKNPKDIFGQTPLHFAAENGDYLLCQLILNVLDDKNPEDDFGLTPLNVAFKKAHHSAKHKAVYELIKETILVDKNMRNQADLSYQMIENEMI